MNNNFQLRYILTLDTMRPGQHLALVLADPPGAPYAGGLSLVHGWLPIVVQIVSGLVLALTLARRSRRWWQVWVPVAALTGVLIAVVVNWYATSHGMTTNPIPVILWIWIALAGVAVVAAVVGWPRTRWRHRVASASSIPLCLLCIAIALNMWIGYFPTVQLAWNQLTAGPLPDETDYPLRARQQAQETSAHGAVVRVDIPSAASGFRHRRELVYVPPAWFATTPPPPLPVVMMIAGAFNTPADWLRAGDAAAAADTFASGHEGNAPVLVFPDSAGTFNNDTECVNGLRGNAADHLVKDVPPFMVSQFGVRPPGHGWGVVGFSMGGTCAIGLTVMHPEVFNSFVAIGGDIGPNVGSVEQTTARLFGGSTAGWDEFDPRTAMQRHGQYTGISGIFSVISSGPSPRHGAFGYAGRGALGHCAYPGEPDNQSVAAVILCLAARGHGIDVAVVTTAGKHDWPVAAEVFANTLPWLAPKLGTPQVPPVPFEHEQ